MERVCCERRSQGKRRRTVLSEGRLYYGESMWERRVRSCCAGKRGDHFGRSSVSVCVTGCGAIARAAFFSLAWLVMTQPPKMEHLGNGEHPPPTNLLNCKNCIYTRFDMSGVGVTQNPFSQPPPSRRIAYLFLFSPTSYQTNLETCVASHLKSCSSSQLPLNSAHLSHWRMLVERLTPSSMSTVAPARQRRVP